MAFEGVKIRSTRNGATSIDGYREDLAIGDLVTCSLTSDTGVSSYRWEMVGRPEGSGAGGPGPEPILLGIAGSASFSIDDDAPHRRDGDYHVRCTLNGGSPSETRIEVALIRVSGLTLADGRVLRKLGGFESMEDTSIASIVQGWATMMNRWLEALRAGLSSGIPVGQTLNQTYAFGAVASDQTLGLLDAKGGTFIVDGSAGGFTGTDAFKIKGPAGAVALVVQRTGNVGIGVAAPAVRLHVQGTAAGATGLSTRLENTDVTGLAQHGIFFTGQSNLTLQLIAYGDAYVQTIAADVQASGLVQTNRAGGLSLSARGSGGSGPPIRFFTWNGAADVIEGVRINDKGALAMVRGALATNAIDGFFFMRSMAGTPTGNADPNTPTGSAPLVVDTTGNLVWFRTNGVWRTLLNGGGGGGGAFTPGSVIFAGATGALAEDNVHFFWDDAGDALGIGLTPVGTSADLYVGKSKPAANEFVLFQNTAPDGFVTHNLRAGVATSQIQILAFGPTYAGPFVGDVVQDSGSVRSNRPGGLSINANAVGASLRFYTSTGGVAVERMRIQPTTGFVGIGTSAPTEPLHVKGATDTGVLIETTSAASASGLFLGTDEGTQAIALDAFGSANSDSGDQRASGGVLRHSEGGGLSISALAGLRFYGGGFDDANERLSILDDGRIGFNNPTPSARFHFVQRAENFALTFPAIDVNGGAHTNMADVTPYIDVSLSLGREIQWQGGGSPSYVSLQIAPPTLKATSATTMARAATIKLVSAPVQGTNMTITDKLSLWSLDGDVRWDLFGGGDGTMTFNVGGENIWRVAYTVDNVLEAFMEVQSTLGLSWETPVPSNFDFSWFPRGVEAFRIGRDAKISFFAHATAGQQTVTGSRGGNAALASLLTKLANTGLIVDGSS